MMTAKHVRTISAVMRPPSAANATQDYLKAILSSPPLPQVSKRECKEQGGCIFY